MHGSRCHSQMNIETSGQFDQFYRSGQHAHLADASTQAIETPGCHSKHHAIIRNGCPTPHNTQVSGWISRTSFEQCRQNLLRAIRGSSDNDFQQFSCALSCVLTAERPLEFMELKDAVKLSTHLQQWVFSRRSKLYQDGQGTGWLRAFGIVFATDNQDRVSFELAAMVPFLRRCHINGIDASHRTLATLCNEQNKLDSNDLTAEAEADGWELLESSNSAFSSYAKTYWHHHVQLAQKTSLMHHLQSNARLGWIICRPVDGFQNFTNSADRDAESVSRDFAGLSM